MRGVVFLGDRKVEAMTFDDPTPGPGEAVLEMKASGMCGSDLKFYRASGEGGTAALGLGELDGPVIAGHEPCGVVAALGPGGAESGVAIGDRVMVHHYKGCGRCLHCGTGWTQMCSGGSTVYGATGHGGHAPYMLAPVAALVPLPEELSYPAGAAISCGTGTAYGALGRLELSGRDTIAVFGQGPVGLSATQLAAAMGARVIALDTVAERRALAEGMGAESVVDAADGDAAEALRALTGGAGVDMALDCTGAAAARDAAVRATRPWGKVCFVGEGGEVTLNVSRDVLRKQLTIIGSWTFSRFGQAECANFVARRGIDVDALFSHRYRLDQAEEAYRLFDTQTTGKGVFLM